MLKKILMLTVFLVSLSFAQTTKKPVFKLTTINGKTITVIGTKNGLILPEYKGKIVLLELWGTHCPPCLYSIPRYIKLVNKYKDKIVMLAIEVQGTPKEQLKAFAKAKGMNYNIFTQNSVIDFNRYVASRSGWQGAIPFLLVFEPDGKVLDIQRGLARNEFQKLEAIINYVFDKKNQVIDKNTSKQDNNVTKENNTTTK